MKRFIWGAVLGAGAGAVVYWQTLDIEAAVVVTVLIAFVVWFTAIGDVIAEIGDDIGEAVAKGLDDLL